MLTAKAFLENRNGERWTWWIQTLYGTQATEGQYHVAPVTKDHLIHQLIESGFERFEAEVGDHNVQVTCYKTTALPWHNEEAEQCKTEVGQLV